MIDMEKALAELGDLLLLDDDDLVGGVIAGIEAPRKTGWPRSTVLKVAAIVAIVAAAAVALVPSTRDAVADWFGLDRVTIDRRDDLDLLPPTVSTSRATTGGHTTTTVATTSTTVPFGERIATVDGQQIRIMRLDGELTDAAINKTVGGTALVVQVLVDNNPGLWIPEPHEMMIERDGEPVFERVAANTLVWQDDDVLWRIEGFQRMEDAVRYAESL